jgi:peptide/nickel transport system permease protein
LLASTFLVYVLVALSGNPLARLSTDRSPNKAQKIAERTELMQLNVPLPERYLGWLGRASGCVLPGKPCDLGRNADGQQVVDLLKLAMGSTLRLVLVATVLALVLGVVVGVISALRQYSGFDYTVTFSAFLFFSLPAFWIAVLLKQFLAIQFNNWLVSPKIGLLVMLALSLLSALAWGALLVTDGNRRRRWIVWSSAFVGSFAILEYLSAVEWFRRPGLGTGAVVGLAFASAIGATALTAGFKHRRVLYTTLATAAVGSVSQFVLAPVLKDPSWLTMIGLGVLALAIGSGIGLAAGGLDRPGAARAGALTAFLTAMWIFTNHVFNAIPDYSRQVNGRMLATIGSGTPDFVGTFWETFLDSATHLLLPTLVIMLISFATYSRFTRASMLDVLSQDYVRTARAKGLTERTVVVRHAFRNALIPIATLAAIDFGAVIGGAVITENVFGWNGMGTLFVQGLDLPDPNQVMAFYLVTAVAVVIFNTLADISYAYLDPRIRL